MSVKVFCDIADLNSIRKFNKNNFVKGFTTNPSLMRKAGAKDYKSYSRQILKVCNKKPISFEVFADSPKLMIEQGVKISKWGKNVYVKVPVTNSKKKFTGKVIRELNSRDIKLNITAVYTAKQTAKILKVINKKTNVIISIFAGRAADTGKDPIPEFIKIEVKDNNVEQALRVLKRKLQRDGFFKVIKLKNTYEKPSEKKKRILQENIKRVKKLNKLKNRI